ncbi:ABC transporter permease [Amycolatopsis sp. 195334CR]|uniref:ABC transporter permease n=1 Tax=Amycolatopsis sp. 195334CR TaxID=2814588 RepID=UPI001A8F2F61|nr:FtsX-like permease family protein [Amycolatopsis sp. 195334CR]MBN6039796.1 FtsX-like permease family protein [Amycolatopsis sp. 195334CR]
MFGLAWRTIKGRKGGFAGAFIALFAASALITGCGILLESGLNSGAPPERYAGAPVVVGAKQALEDPNVPDIPYGGRVRLPADTVAAVAAVPGVASALGDVSFPVTMAKDGAIVRPASAAVYGHGWDSAALGPFQLTGGRAPAGANEVVLDDRLAGELGLGVDSRFTLAVGAVPSEYRVVGLTGLSGDGELRQHAVFFTPAEAGKLGGHPGQVDAVGVLPAAGADPAELATRIDTALSGRGVQLFTGDERGAIEFLDVAQAKGTLVAVAGSFGGVALMVALFIVASTLALQIQQRRRELALLRAIAATPKQLHRLIGIESVLVALVAALLGLVPGVLLSSAMRDAFAGIGLVPADFALVTGPVPMLVAVVLCVVAARVAGWLSARKAARIRPVEALGEAAVQSPKLGWVRSVVGVLLLAAGVGLSMLPLVVSGDTATGAAAMSVVVLVIAVALLGPRLAVIAIVMLGPFLRASSRTGGYLAAANTRANSRRLASAITPLVLAIAIASVQLFTGTTRMAIAEDQASAGVVADYVVSGGASGLSPRIADEVAAVPGVATATPVLRTQLLGDYFVAGATNSSTRAFGAQGVAPAGLAANMDLDVRQGSMDQLTGDTVALSQVGSELFEAGPGQRIQLHLGDGTPINPMVVAVYGNGLGFGDLTLPRDVLLAHSPNGLDDMVLVKAEPGAAEAVRTALEGVAAKYLGVGVQDRAGFSAAQQGKFEMQGLATTLLLIAVFAYIAIGVANTLVMATAERRREFALLRLVGTDRRQVSGMMRTEAFVVIVIAAVIGSVLAVPPLVGVSLGLSERADPYPAVDVLTYLAILAVTALIALLSIMIPARLAMRTRPVEAIGTRE